MPRYLAGLTLCLLLGCSRRPDVILLTVDTLRRDHVSAFNADSPVQTPNIDALAGDGVAYTDAWSPISVTGPAFCTLFTGQDPGTHGVVMNVFRGGADLPDSAETLTERLQTEGYSTGAFVSGFTLREELGLNQGFDTYDAVRGDRTRRRGGRTAENAITWLFKSQGPLLLWYHTYDVHGPWDRWDSVPEEGPWKRQSSNLGRVPRYQRIGHITDPAFYEQRYAASVAHTDEVLGRIITALKQDGRYKRALIVLTADHGESFTERELWFDHGTSAHAEQLAVPLIVKLPGNEGAGSQVDGMVGLRDVAPTVLELLDLPPLASADGQSVVPTGPWSSPSLLLGESSHCKKDPPLSCAPHGVKGKVVGARDARFSVIRTPLLQGESWELYDRVADPLERVALDPSARPAELTVAVNALWRARQTLSYDLPEGGAGQDGSDTDEETEALRALGYLDE